MNGRPPAQVHLTWVGGHAFTGGKVGGPQITIDGDNVLGPGPVLTLLMALAACTGYDIVDILEKRRTPIASMTIAVHGERFDGVPGRLMRVVLSYEIRGAGIEAVHAERAVELSVTKYCSVRDSLDPNLPVEWVVRVNTPPDAVEAV